MPALTTCPTCGGRAVRLVALATLICTPLRAQQPIPLRTVAIVAATDSSLLRNSSYTRAQTNVANLRVLSDGHLIVNDAATKRVLFIDSTLTKYTILADTAPGAPQRYTTRYVVSIIPYLGDSTLYMDMEASTLVVIDPSGRFVRVMAPPSSKDFSALQLPGAGFDPKGRVIYRGVPPLSSRAQRPAADGSGKQIITVNPDSVVIVRGNFDTRTLDTIAKLSTGISKTLWVSSAVSAFSSTAVLNPLPVIDDWALLPDGTVAIVRGRDYHIDWLSPNGTVTSTAKMPFDWKHITTAEKEQLLDSLKAAETARRLALPPSSAPPRPFAAVDVADLPDYYPSIRAGQVRADRAGNVWILPSTSTLSTGSVLNSRAAPVSGLVYDVVNRSGTIVERVRLPEGRNLAGFGPGGTVYLTHALSATRVVLERARVVRP